MAVATARTITETVDVEPTMHMKLNPPVKKQSQTTMPMNPRRLRLDPLRALEPTRKKISTIEAQRVMSVFEDTIRRVEVITLLPYIMNNLDKVKGVLGYELMQMLEKHKVIVQSYTEIRNVVRRRIAKMKAKQAKREASSTSSTCSCAEEMDEETAAVVEPEEAVKVEKGVVIKEYAEEEKEEVEEEEVKKEVVEEEEEEMGEKKVAESATALPEGPKTTSTTTCITMTTTATTTEGCPSSRPTSSSESLTSKTLELEVDSMSRQLTLVAAQLSHSCKNILRIFQINPNAMNTILEGMDFRTDESKILVNCLKTLRDIILGKLLTTPEEEKERMLYLEQVSERERQNAVVISKLEAELRTAIADKDDEIRRKNNIIRRLQGDLNQIERLSEEHIRRVKAEAEKQEAADIKNSEGKRQKLQQELNQLKTQLQNQIQEHHESEQELRRKKYKVETEVENIIQRFDQDMGERQDEYEEIDAIYTEEKKQLHELEERFATLEEEYLGIMEERRLARERRERAEREMAMLVKCATTIQAFWRSYKVRKALKSKKKKGGKKKK